MGEEARDSPGEDIGSSQADAVLDLVARGQAGLAECCKSPGMFESALMMLCVGYR
jgi:hypothetical protein